MRVRLSLATAISEDLESALNGLDKDLFKSKRILMTGGAGFIGSWLCDALVSMGSAVHCIDNLSTGLIENITHLPASNFVFQKSDVTSLQQSDEKYETILHFASHASPDEFQQRPIETLAANANGTQNMLELARKSDATLLYASSSEIYGDAEIVPTPETYWGKVNPIGLRSCYDEGKRVGEAFCVAYHRTYDLDVRIIRFFNTYGPRLRSDGIYGRALSRFVKQALSGKEITVYGTGRQTRSFCYISDTLRAILLATSRTRMKNEIINVGNPQEISILELAEKIKTLTASKSRTTFLAAAPDDPQRRCPDISKAKKSSIGTQTYRLMLD
jgi:UDP-glucuronate decarboxylase